MDMAYVEQGKWTNRSVLCGIVAGFFPFPFDGRISIYLPMYLISRPSTSGSSLLPVTHSSLYISITRIAFLQMTNLEDQLLFTPAAFQLIGDLQAHSVSGPSFAVPRANAIGRWQRLFLSFFYEFRCGSGDGLIASLSRLVSSRLIGSLRGCD